MNIKVGPRMIKQWTAKFQSVEASVSDLYYHLWATVHCADTWRILTVILCQGTLTLLVYDDTFLTLNTGLGAREQIMSS